MSIRTTSTQFAESISCVFDQRSLRIYPKTELFVSIAGVTHSAKMTTIDVQEILENGQKAATNTLNAFSEQLSSLGAKMTSEVDSEAHQVSFTSLPHAQ